MSEVSGETACWESLARQFSLSFNRTDKCWENVIYMKTMISLQIKFVDSQTASVLLIPYLQDCELLHFRYSDNKDTITQGAVCVKKSLQFAPAQGHPKTVLSPQLHPGLMLWPPFISFNTVQSPSNGIGAPRNCCTIFCEPQVLLNGTRMCRHKQDDFSHAFAATNS